MRVIFLAVLVFLTPLYAEAIEGFWQNTNPKTGRPKMVVAVYAHEDTYYGRILASYDEKGELDDTIYHAEGKAPGIKGTPFYAGLDFIWNVKKNGKRYKGKIIDPRNGKIYDVELWRQGEDLIIRGFILCFGKNETWTKVQESCFTHAFAKPDVRGFIPIIPESVCKQR